jgi:hypothetical protein
VALSLGTAAMLAVQAAPTEFSTQLDRPIASADLLQAVITRCYS